MNKVHGTSGKKLWTHGLSVDTQSMCPHKQIQIDTVDASVMLFRNQGPVLAHGVSSAPDDVDEGIVI